MENTVAPDTTPQIGILGQTQLSKSKMETIIIAAVAKNRVIGNKGEIPWKLPQDLKHFRKLTLNNAVIMGRKTYESIIERNKKPLDKRLNIVLSKREEFVREGVVTAHSIEEALEIAAGMYQKAYIIGGEVVYDRTIGLVSKMELTEVNQEPEGDAYFPEFDRFDWTKDVTLWKRDFNFVTYTRK